MNTIIKNIPVLLKLPYESTATARAKKRLVHLNASVRPESHGLRNSQEVHFEIPDRFKASFDYVVFQLQSSTIDWMQTTCNGWATTNEGSIDTNSVFLCVRYV